MKGCEREGYAPQESLSPRPRRTLTDEQKEFIPLIPQRLAQGTRREEIAALIGLPKDTTFSLIDALVPYRERNKLFRQGQTARKSLVK